MSLGVLLLVWAAPALGASFHSWTTPPDRPLVPLAGLQQKLFCDPIVDIGPDETLCGDTTGLTSGIDLYPCSTWPETGGEIVYRLTLDQPVAFAARLDADCDLDLAVLGGCGAEDPCFLVSDVGIKSDGAVSGTFYLVVDGYNGAACSFCLTVGPPDIVATDDDSWSLVKSRFDDEGRMP
jgi:hypothetical protein